MAKRYLILALVLSGCGFLPAKPSAVTETTTIWSVDKDNPAHANFLANVDEYTNLLAISIHASCIDVPDPLPDTDIGFYSLKVTGGNRGLYTKPDNIIIYEEDPKPFAVYGHELVRHMLYRSDNSLWQACSVPCAEYQPYGWETEPVNCMWQTAENLSLEYDL